MEELIVALKQIYTQIIQDHSLDNKLNLNRGT